jgi:hypothetical protein
MEAVNRMRTLDTQLGIVLSDFRQEYFTLHPLAEVDCDSIVVRCVSEGFTQDRPIEFWNSPKRAYRITANNRGRIKLIVSDGAVSEMHYCSDKGALVPNEEIAEYLRFAFGKLELPTPSASKYSGVPPDLTKLLE